MNSDEMPDEKTGLISLNPTSGEQQNVPSAKTQMNSGGSGKISSFQNQVRRPKRHRRFLIPTSKDDLEQNIIKNAYECEGKSLVESTLWKIPRPLPTMTALATQPASDGTHSRGTEAKKYSERGLSMPLLQPYLKNLERNGHLKTVNGSGDTKTTHDDNEEQQSKSSTTMIDEIDDPNSSTLTRGQQKRYKELQLEKQAGNKVWNDIKRKEYNRLVTSVQQEQILYQQALDRFFERHESRFLLGFGRKSGDNRNDSNAISVEDRRATAFALVQSSYIQQYRTQWELSNCPTKFGPCRQSISLQGVNLAQATGRRNKKNRNNSSMKLTLEDLSSEILHTECTGTESLPKANWSLLGKGGYVLSPPPLTRINFSSRTLLRNDQIALRLAKDHHVHILTTIETLQSLLQMPGESSTRWTLPLQSIEVDNNNGTHRQEQDKAPSRRNQRMPKSNLVILDVPVPQPSTPRYCLGRGFQEGLYHAAATTAKTSTPASTDSGSSESDGNVEYVYTLLTLPSLRQRQNQKQCRVLVRSTNRLVDNHSENMEHESLKPVRIHAQLEYFPERGWEKFTPSQKAMWILDKILQPEAKVMVGRVCPQTASVLRFEEVSVAHALAGAESISGGVASTAGKEWQVVDPMYHLQSMVELLHGLDVLDRGEQLLCLPGINLPSSAPATRSVSVHKVDTIDMQIDLRQELQNADAVYRGSEFLRQCFPQWIWEAERIPFTFPVKDEEGSSTFDRK